MDREDQCFLARLPLILRWITQRQIMLLMFSHRMALLARPEWFCNYLSHVNLLKLADKLPVRSRVWILAFLSGRDGNRTRDKKRVVG
jgi:hypothetical protein